METWNTKILNYLNGSAAIIVGDAHDYKMLKDILKDMHLFKVVLKGQENINYWRELAKINSKPDNFYYGQKLIFEFQPGKGTAFDWNLKNAKDWYGSEYVFTAKQLFNEWQEIKSL